MITLQRCLTQVLLVLSKSVQQYFTRSPAFNCCFWMMLGSGAYLLSCSFCMALGFGCMMLSAYNLPSKQTLWIYIQGLSLGVFGFLYTHLCDAPALPQNAHLHGSGIFHVQEKKETTLFGKKALYYKGVLKTFTDTHGTIYKNIPGSIRRPLHKPLCQSDKIFLSSLELIVKDTRQFSIKLSNTLQGDPASRGYCFTHMRYLAKNTLLKRLQPFYEDKKTYAFISAMVAGYLDNKTLMYEFSKTGIQHLLTISGFHFSLLMMFLTAIFKPWMPKKVFVFILCLFLTLYVIYLGPSPSVSRSWIAALLWLVAYSVEIPSHPINYLSIGAILAFLENPLCLTQMGFQFSYLATFGILSYYCLCDRWMSWIIPTRHASVLKSCKLPKRIFFAFLILIRKSIALDHAVNLITLPVIYYHFESFPYFSFYFNLLIPALLLPSLYLLLIGLLCAPFSVVEQSMHTLNHLYTKSILDSVAACPKILEISLVIKNIKALQALAALMLIFLALLVYTERSYADEV